MNDEPKIRHFHRSHIRTVSGGRDYRHLHYALDAEGRLWKGPSSRDDNMHWAVLTGVGQAGPSWTLSRSDPDMAWVQITPYQAARHVEDMVEAFVREEEERIRREAAANGEVLYSPAGNRDCPNCGRRLRGAGDKHYVRDAKGAPVYECIREWWKGEGQ